MPLFDRYIAVDWSARNEPTTKARMGADAIWIGVVLLGASALTERSSAGLGVKAA